jgi:outer membrane scaffolding protein for murein synthesis (MipA/OmpV family)
MGVRDASLSVGVKRALGPHWLVFGGVGVRRLLGPAADSPWVQQPGSHQVNLGVAWRR